ncbi:unnamed protein product, partial [Sphacelaria rigidula]
REPSGKVWRWQTSNRGCRRRFCQKHFLRTPGAVRAVTPTKDPNIGVYTQTKRFNSGKVSHRPSGEDYCVKTSPYRRIHYLDCVLHMQAFVLASINTWGATSFFTNLKPANPFIHSFICCYHLISRYPSYYSQAS